MKCRICYHEGDYNTYEVKEMMFGIREHFTYFQCNNCECLQIREFPIEMAKYYPSAYHSFFLNPSKSKNIIKRILIGLRNKYAIFNKYKFIGKFLFNQYERNDLKSLSYIQDLNKNTSIVDVGCGSGYTLYDLKELGFTNLLGIDPFIKNDISYRNGLKILKKEISELKEKFNIVMMHHVLEHIDDQHTTFKNVNQILKISGIFLLRIPVVPSFVWNKYKENWVALDAPRHFFLHSVKSIKFLAKEYSFYVEKIVYDSEEFQFWGSEQYEMNIPLVDKNSHYKFQAERKDVFTKDEIHNYKKLTIELNKKKEGDSAAFILRKIK